MYTGDKLKKYIEESVLKVVDEDFCIRLSKELAEKYDSDVYASAINNFKNYISQIKNLNLKYPANANPIFYIYLVPDNDFIDLLQFPLTARKGGGKPVFSYDIDGFNSAYGSSQNMWENTSEEPSISRVVNEIHELAHLVESMFFNKNRFLSEGFAEALPLYTMDYESKFDEHRNAIKDMKLNQIFSVKELLDMQRNNTFGGEALIPNRSCSFDLSYISSYLFTRGCIETIDDKSNIGRIKATQQFLEIARSSQCTNEWLVYDIADALEQPRDELLEDKTLQIKTLQNINNDLSMDIG